MTATWTRNSNHTGEDLVGHNGRILATVWRRRTLTGGYTFRCGDLFAERATYAEAKAAAKAAVWA